MEFSSNDDDELPEEAFDDLDMRMFESGGPVAADPSPPPPVVVAHDVVILGTSYLFDVFGFHDVGFVDAQKSMVLGYGYDLHMHFRRTFSANPDAMIRSNVVRVVCQGINKTMWMCVVVWALNIYYVTDGLFYDVRTKVRKNPIRYPGVSLELLQHLERSAAFDGRVKAVVSWIEKKIQLDPLVVVHSGQLPLEIFGECNKRKVVVTAMGYFVGSMNVFPKIRAFIVKHQMEYKALGAGIDLIRDCCTHFNKFCFL